MALDVGAEEHGVGYLAPRRRPSGLCLEPFRVPLNDDSEQSTPTPEEDRTVAPECPDGMLWGETPTASMGAAMIEQMMKYKATPGLLQPPGARPAEESLAPPAPAEPPAPAGRTVMLQIPLQVACAHPLAAGVVSGLEVSILETRLEDGCMVINLRVDVGAGGAVAFEPSLAPRPPPPAPTPAPAALAERRRGSGKAAPRAVEGSAMVCCHWKNKGFCKYENSCKFQHPEHKRGVSLPGGAGLLRSAAQAQRSAPRPGGAPVAKGPLAGVASCPLPGAMRPAFAVAASGRYS